MIVAQLSKERKKAKTSYVSSVREVPRKFSKFRRYLGSFVPTLLQG